MNTYRTFIKCDLSESTIIRIIFAVHICPHHYKHASVLANLNFEFEFSNFVSIQDVKFPTKTIAHVKFKKNY